MAARYELVLDVLGYYAEMGDDNALQRCEVEGKGRVFSASDLHPAALERGLETGALVLTNANAAAEAAADSNSGGWPSTHKELDALAKDAGITFPKKTSVAAKIELLEAANAAAEAADPEPAAGGDPGDSAAAGE